MQTDRSQAKLDRMLECPAEVAALPKAARRTVVAKLLKGQASVQAPAKARQNFVVTHSNLGMRQCREGAESGRSGMSPLVAASSRGRVQTTQVQQMAALAQGMELAERSQAAARKACAAAAFAANAVRVPYHPAQGRRRAPFLAQTPQK